MPTPFLSDYNEWLQIADAALPRNIFGYILTRCLEPLRTDPFTTLPYDNPKEIAKCGGEIGEKSYLQEELVEREGGRPEMARWMAPHRQVSQRAGEGMHDLLQEALKEIALKYPSYITLSTSILEKEGPALFISPSIPTPHTIAKATKREIVHIHTGPDNNNSGPGDWSMHLCLSPKDCKKVIGKGWGERITLSGSLIPEEYLMVYSPRTKEEVAVVRGIVEAAVGFMTGGLGHLGET